MEVERDFIKETLSDLNQNLDCLSESQTALVKSIEKYFKRNKRLSEKQVKILFEIRKYMNS